MLDSKLCLVDANSLFYRAFFAIKAPLVTSSGQPTNAVFGFVKMLRRIREELTPGYFGICFDVSKTTHRTKKFSDYKIHRAPMPSELLSQVPLIKEVVGAYRYRICEREGFEADDVIATLATRMADKVKKVVIISSDKDILQLVGGNIEVYNPYKEEGIVFTKDIVKEKFGVEPKKISDLISLMGDASDNIPGAHGIGEKTALGLLTEFEDAEDIIEHASKIKRESLRKIVQENRDLIRLSKELAMLRYDVPLDVELADLEVKPPDADKLWDVFSRLEFKGMLKELSEDRLSSGVAPTFDIPQKNITDFNEILGKIASKKIYAFYIERSEEDSKNWKVNLAFDSSAVYVTDNTDFLKNLFSEKKYLVVTHDAKNAKHFLSQLGIVGPVQFFDTMIAAHLADSSKSSAALEGLLWDHLSLKGLNRLDYSGKESHFLFRLKENLEKILEEKGLLSLFYDVETPLSDILFSMEAIGVNIDWNLLKSLSKELEKKLEKLVASIYELAGCEFNINSPKQLSDILFNKLKLPVVKKTKTGFSTDEEVLTRLAKTNELPKILLEYRQFSKLKTTYVDAFPEWADEKTKKIHASFNQIGTETGRLSSNSPNLQNIPIKTEFGRKIRQTFIPSEGFDGILSADYSQVELRILAHLSQDEVLAQAFRASKDIHVTTASLIFGVEEKDVTDEMRNNAKRVNFGIIYGISSYGLAKDLDVDPKTAENFIQEYFLRYPKVKGYLDSQIEFVKKNGFVTTILGRRRYIPEFSNPNMAIRQFAERQAINAPIQGSAADLIKRSMVDVAKSISEKGLKSRLILQVHDELVFEVKRLEKDILIDLVRTCMENAIVLTVPLKTILSYGKNWLETEEVS